MIEKARSLLRFMIVRILLTITVTYLIFHAVTIGIMIGGKVIEVTLGSLAYLGLIIYITPYIKDVLERHLSKQNPIIQRIIVILVIVLTPIWIYLLVPLVGTISFSFLLVFLLWLLTTLIGFSVYFIYRLIKHL